MKRSGWGQSGLGAEVESEAQDAQAETPRVAEMPVGKEAWPGTGPPGRGGAGVE